MSNYPATMYSALISLQSDDPVERQLSLERLLRAYTKPIYKHLRLKWRKTQEDAEDLVQDFFARVVERSVLAQYDPKKGKFRTYIRTCVDNFVTNAEQARTRLKRSGGAEIIDSSTREAEREVLATSSTEDTETVFEREWVRNVFGVSVNALEAQLRATNKARYFDVFQRLDLSDPDERPTYAEVAGALGISVADVTNYLHAARKELRRLVLDTLRELTASEDEFRLEAKALLGVDV